MINAHDDNVMSFLFGQYLYRNLTPEKLEEYGIHRGASDDSDDYSMEGKLTPEGAIKKMKETALCSVNSSHRVTSFPSRSLSLRLFLWNWQRDIWKPIEGYGEKGNIFRSKLERSFLRNCSVFC